MKAWFKKLISVEGGLILFPFLSLWKHKASDDAAFIQRETETLTVYLLLQDNFTVNFFSDHYHY